MNTIKMRKSLWDELDDKLQDDGTYHVSRELMFQIVSELERFRDSQDAGCIVPNLPNMSQITVSYTKGEPQSKSPISSRKRKI